MVSRPSVIVICAVALVARCSAGEPPKSGPYKVASKVYKVLALDSSNQDLHVFWPSSPGAGESFPLVSYMHGMSGGGIDIVAYRQLFKDMASYGLVVVAPGGCGAITGKACNDPVNSPYTDCAGLPSVSPKGWASYYGEGLKGLEWAKNMSATEPAAKLVDWSLGVGICGHSMGGQAAALASGAGCSKKWDIRAAALHHPASGDIGAAGNIGFNISVPFAAFTTSGDGIWPETRDIYFNSSSTPRVYRDQVGFSHMEPLKLPAVKWYNPWLATMTAAWFKLYLGGDSSSQWHSMIYNSSDPLSLCNYAGPKGMANCETVEQ